MLPFLVLLFFVTDSTPNIDAAKIAPEVEYEVTVEDIEFKTDVEYYTVIQGAGWSSPPNIQVCEDSPFSAKKIEKELKWWQQLAPSYQYGEITTAICGEFDTPDGTIRFTRANSETLSTNKWAAYANTKLNDDGTIKWSKVSLDESNDSWIIRHEIGHAFGWDHVPEEQLGHLMNTHVGDNIDGLQAYTIRNQDEED
jgi:hypothetical protein